MVTERRQRDGSGQRPRVLIIVQNLPVPFDRRVWLECQSLTEAGYDVTVICPSGIAVRRGRKAAEHVTVVRTGPDPDRLRAVPADPALRRGREHLVAYLGVMGHQDGVDITVAAADVIVNHMGRTDISFTLTGSGDCYDDLVAQRDRLGLQDYVELTGRVPDETVANVLSTADIGLSPDPKNPLNDVSAMNKTMEYMAFGLPVVAFDLHETRVSAGEAAVYAEPNKVEDYARAIVELVDDPETRAEMGRRERVEQKLAWIHQKKAYVAVFDELVGRKTVVPATDGVQSVAPTGLAGAEA